MAVVILMALVAAGATLRYGPILDEARLQTTIDQWADYEALVRRICRTHERVAVIDFDLEESRVVVHFETYNDRLGSKPVELRSWQAVAGTSVTNLQMPGRHFAIHRSVQLRVSREGQTPTYAICFETAKARRWLVFAGGSGRILHCDQEQEVRRILQAADT